MTTHHAQAPHHAVEGSPLYVVGDLQGCLTPLQRALDRVGFDPANGDTLWLTGDLVNRGPESLAALHFVRNLGDSAVTVLGNHDLHLLAVHAGLRGPKTGDTLESILASPDRDALVDWLRRRPMLHHSASRQLTLVHAGIPPVWDLDEARREAERLEQALRADDWAATLGQLFGNEPAHWAGDLAGIDRLRYTVNALTRMRYWASDGRMDLRSKSGPEEAPADRVPWFRAPNRRPTGPVVFGHWSTLGRLIDEEAGVYALDSGCVWGGELTLIAMHARPCRIHAVPCEQALAPGSA